jgi:DNA (cytosine-5)-methyltransferase 1
MGRPKLRVLDLFSGIGGFSLGLERTQGFETVAFCEIEEYPRRVLAKHWPKVPIYHDVRELTADTLRRDGIAVDVICGGFPCQDVSRAGKRAGLSGERSGLYRELVRAIRVVRPRHAIVENVAALLGDGMGTVLGDMAESGFDLEWDCVPAKAIGAPHERDRVWIVAHAHSERFGEEGRFRYRSIEMSAGRTEAPQSANTESIRCGQGRTRRPPDSFAWVRDAAREHAAHAAGARLEGWQKSEAAWEALAEPAGGYSNPWRPWTDEPEISGMDDGFPNWVDSTRATGNAVVPQIPELIGHAILKATE